MNKEGFDHHKFTNPEKYPDYQTYDICINALSHSSGYLFHIEHQTEELCLFALSRTSHCPIMFNAVLKGIHIPITREFNKKINRLKLLKEYA